jgi:hypothetical protein
MYKPESVHTGIIYRYIPTYTRSSANWGVHTYAEYAKSGLVTFLHIAKGFTYLIAYFAYCFTYCIAYSMHILHIVLHILNIVLPILHIIMCTGGKVKSVSREEGGGVKGANE